MEQGEAEAPLSRKELRKQKFMEYLAAKGRLKVSNPNSHGHDDGQNKRPVTSALKVLKGKENNPAPAGAFKHEETKLKSVAAHSIHFPVKKVFGVTRTGNAAGGVPSGKPNAKPLPLTSGPAKRQPPSHLPVRTGVSAPVISSNSRPSATGHLRNQPSARRAPPSRASSSAAFGASGRVSSGPAQTSSCRMSLGPMVKTKTGLTPAVTRPRSAKTTQEAHAPAPRGTAVAAHKARPRPSAPLPLVHGSSTWQRKTLPSASLNRLVDKRTTVSSTTFTGLNVVDRNALSRSQLPSKGRASSGLKSAAAAFTFRAGVVKPEGTGAMSSTYKVATGSTDGYARPKSAGGREINGNPRKCPPRTSSVPTGRIGVGVVSVGGKTKTAEEAKSKTGPKLANPPPPKTDGRTAGASAMSTQRLSQSARPPGTKAAKVNAGVLPQTEVKKLTVAQEERLRRLQEWRESKGISYKRPPMPAKPQAGRGSRAVAAPQPYWASMEEEEDEAHSLAYVVDRSLGDCIKLLREGCPSDKVTAVLARLPAACQKFAKYWICQVRLMEQEGRLDVLPVFEQAVRVVAEPVDELRAVVFEILKKKDEIQALESNEKEEGGTATPGSSPGPMATPKPVRVLISGEKGDSSVVKYKITATPGGPASQQREPARVNGQEVRFFTPVRRSVRIEKASLRYPVSLQDHDLCVASYSELLCEEDGGNGAEVEEEEEGDAPIYIYRQNDALEDKVLVKLVYD